MNDIYVTLTGNVAAEPRQYTFDDGVKVTSLRVLTNHRYFDKKTGQWTDGERVAFAVRCWRELGDNVAQSIRVGHPVVVQGKLRIREFEGEEGRRFMAEVEAISVGHNLRWGTGSFAKPERGVASRERRDLLDEDTQDWAMTTAPAREPVTAARADGWPGPAWRHDPAPTTHVEIVGLAADEPGRPAPQPVGALPHAASPTDAAYAIDPAPQFSSPSGDVLRNSPDGARHNVPPSTARPISEPAPAQHRNSSPTEAPTAAQNGKNSDPPQEQGAATARAREGRDALQNPGKPRAARNQDGVHGREGEESEAAQDRAGAARGRVGGSVAQWGEEPGAVQDGGGRGAEGSGGAGPESGSEGRSVEVVGMRRRGRKGGGARESEAGRGEMGAARDGGLEGDTGRAVMEDRVAA